MEFKPKLKIRLRVPGFWSRPEELFDRLPSGSQATGNVLILEDGTEITLSLLGHDREFNRIFRGACRRPPNAFERSTISEHTLCFALDGPGGSMDSAMAMLRAGATIVKAGGAGVYIDHSALAHGGQEWIDLAEEGGPDAIGVAFTGLVVTPNEMFTTGMHTMGFPDLVMRSLNVEKDQHAFTDLIRIVCRLGQPIDVGPVFSDQLGGRIQATNREPDPLPVDFPMSNPFGRVRVASAGDFIAQLTTKCTNHTNVISCRSCDSCLSQSRISLRETRDDCCEVLRADYEMNQDKDRARVLLCSRQ